MKTLCITFLIYNVLRTLQLKNRCKPYFYKALLTMFSVLYLGSNFHIELSVII